MSTIGVCTKGQVGYKVRRVVDDLWQCLSDPLSMEVTSEQGARICVAEPIHTRKKLSESICKGQKPKEGIAKTNAIEAVSDTESEVEDLEQNHGALRSSSIILYQNGQCLSAS